MDLDYQPNSHKFKEEQEKNIQKVVTGKTKAQKNSFRKFTDVFIAEDVTSVKGYIFMEVLVPAIKKAIFDIITNGIDMILYGENGNKSKNTTASKISYRNFYTQPKTTNAIKNNRAALEYDDILFESRKDAEAVLSEMENVVDKFDFVSVGDLYDLADISTNNYAVNKYGWNENIHSATVVRTRDGYVIKFPKVTLLD